MSECCYADDVADVRADDVELVRAKLATLEVNVTM